MDLQFSSFDVVTSVGMDSLLKDRLSLDFLCFDFGAGSSIDIDINLVLLLQYSQSIFDVMVLLCT